MIRAVVALIALTLPGTVAAQIYQCSSAGGLQRPHPELPSDTQPRRVLPIGGYTLAITWAPQYCREHADEAQAQFECGGSNRFGFTLHGLWPDGVGRDWPQYCRTTGPLPPAVVRRQLCMTPSAQLLQHEWAKHGTCIPGDRPTTYFARSARLYARLRYPDMDALSRSTLTAAMLAAAVARANPGLDAGAIRVTADRDGWLDELWMCLDRRFRFTRCPSRQGGLPTGSTIRIWRGRR